VQEGNRAIAEVGYRATDFITLFGGYRRELHPDSFSKADDGFMGQTIIDIGSFIGLEKNLVNLYVNGHTSGDSAIGLGGVVRL
jgi:hypothetical protein